MSAFILHQQRKETRLRVWRQRRTGASAPAWAPGRPGFSCQLSINPFPPTRRSTHRRKRAGGKTTPGVEEEGADKDRHIGELYNILEHALWQSLPANSRIRVMRGTVKVFALRKLHPGGRVGREEASHETRSVGVILPPWRTSGLSALPISLFGGCRNTGRTLSVNPSPRRDGRSGFRSGAHERVFTSWARSQHDERSMSQES